MIKCIKNNIKTIFCCILILIAILFAVYIFIKKPEKTIDSYIYNTGRKSQMKNVTFPLIQKININTDNLKTLTIYYQDLSINKFKYNLMITDGEKELKTLEYENYESNIAIVSVEDLSLKKGDVIYLKYICNDCQNVKVDLTVPLNEDDTIQNTDKSLNIILQSREKDNSYYWYSGMLIFFALVLLPFARKEDKDVSIKK